jgi:hypothetical protein
MKVIFMVRKPKPTEGCRDDDGDDYDEYSQ